ncbi:MAG TPA: hypothetical protein VH108_01610, partial [Gaiellaceae bacterium]|nr:hypothetical protein [Gaiellaceae bacterium]
MSSRRRYRTASTALFVLCLLALGAGAGAAGASAPTNDDLVNATVLAPSSGGSLTSDNTGATKETGEPDHAGDPGGASIWFDWTPSSSGPVSIDTTGSAFDTLLAVYTGASYATPLTLVASNDDFGDSSGPSRVCFDATASTTYHVAVDGYGGDTGSVALAWGTKADLLPCPTLPPTISGTLHVGQTLTSTTGTWLGTGLSFTRQWVRCAGGVCSEISGATGSSYTLVARDAGTDIRVDVTAANGSGSARSSSDPTGVIATTAIVGTNGKIFWTSNRPAGGSNFDIYSANPDGSSVSQVTSSTNFETEPAPSPDGSKIAISVGGTITVMNQDGSGAVSLGDSGQFPVWSPDGSRIAYSDFSGKVDVVDATTGTGVVLPIDGTVYDIDWAPDGTKLALSVKPTGES